MSRKSKRQPPKYRRHANGQAFVQHKGRRFYLGKHGTDDSFLRYEEFLAELREAPQRIAAETTAHFPAVVTVKQVAAAYWQHAKVYYRRSDDKPTSELSNVRCALKPLASLYGDAPAVEFDTVKLEAIRDQLIAEGLCRKTINDRIGLIRRVFRWAASKKMVAASVWHELQTVAGLKKNRTIAPDYPEVKGVADEIIEATLPHLGPVVADMVRIQRRIGARPGELCIMRPRDVDRYNPNYIDKGEQLWLYTPSRHKTEHHGHSRPIPIGLRAQAILAPYLLRDPDAFCFSPCENDQRAGKPRPSAAAHYDKDSYAGAVEAACELAFGMPAELRPKARRLDRMTPEAQAAELLRRDLAAAWRAQHCWRPNQLRHAFCEEYEQKFGYETARVLLGHSDVKTTKIYAGRDLARALAAIREVG